MLDGDYHANILNIRYVAKYATKAERQAPQFGVMLNDILGSVQASTRASTVCQKLLNKMIGEREYSAQETHHLLNGLPLYHSSRSFDTLSLTSTGALRVLYVDGPGDEEIVTGHSKVTRYAQLRTITIAKR